MKRSICLYSLLAGSLVVLGAGCSDDVAAAVDTFQFQNDINTVVDLSPDLGSPDIDVTKMPKITTMIPNCGFSNGGKTGAGTPVLLSGQNFEQGATVYIDGQPQPLTIQVISKVSMQFKMPPNPYDKTKATKVSVRVYIKSMMSNAVDFQYTLTKPMTADFKGVIAAGTPTSYAEFWSDEIPGKVYYKGVTDTTTGASKYIKAEIGYGTSGTNPGEEPGWKWSPAKFIKDDATTGHDHYSAKLKMPLEKKYAIAYRFSYEKTGFGPWGEWVYADRDDADLVYSAKDEATLTASKAPDFFCQADADCALERFLVICKLNSSKPKAARCVGCLKDADCKKTLYWMGTNCQTTTNTCYCKADAECAGSLNGFLCHTTMKSPYCGCKSDTNCPKGSQCDTQKYFMCL